MKRRILLIISLMLVVAGSVVLVSRMRSPTSATEDPWAVWITVLKGFGGPVYYVGSDGEFAYFRTGRVFWSYYKVRAGHAHLPRTFPIGADEPYLVRDQSWVSYYRQV